MHMCVYVIEREREKRIENKGNKEGEREERKRGMEERGQRLQEEEQKRERREEMGVGGGCLVIV